MNLTTQTILQDAEIYINERQTFIIDAIIQVGHRLIEVKVSLDDNVSFNQWITDRLPFGTDTARNYIQVAQNFPELPGSVSQNMTARAIYLLSSPDVSDEDREAAIQFAHGSKLNYNTSYILAHAPSYIKQNWQDGELATNQAYDFSVAYKASFEDIKIIAREYQVTSVDVLTFLKRCYVNHKRSTSTDTSWNDILHNNGHLQYEDETIALKDASPEACDQYTRFRQLGHINGNQKFELLEEHILILDKSSVTFQLPETEIGRKVKIKIWVEQ